MNEQNNTGVAAPEKTMDASQESLQTVEDNGTIDLDSPGASLQLMNLLLEKEGVKKTVESEKSAEKEEVAPLEKTETPKEEKSEEQLNSAQEDDSAEGSEEVDGEDYSERVKKRIGKATAQKKEALEQLQKEKQLREQVEAELNRIKQEAETYKAEAENFKKSKPEPTSFDDIYSIDELEKNVSKHREILNVLESTVHKKPLVDENSGEEYWDVGGNKLTRDRVADLIYDLKKKVYVEAPSREKAIKNFHESDKTSENVIRESFDWYAKSDSYERGIYNKVVSKYQDVFRKYPELKEGVAAWTHLVAMQEKQAQQPKAPVKEVKPAMPSAAAPASSSDEASKFKIRQQYERILDSGDILKAMEFKEKHKL